MTDNLKAAAVSDRGLSEKRPQNEDSYLEMSSRGLFAVADGVGGAQAGEVASQMAMEILGEAFANLQEGGDAEDLMKRAIERANEAIFQMSHDLPQLSSMATTIVALHIDGDIATIGHVGDSRLYRVDPSGNLYRETNDHSVVEEEVRAGRMTAAQAATHPSRNIISRALGAENAVEIDMKTIMIEPNTSFLLCSDGITRHIEDHELRQLLISGNSPEQICEDMKHICYGRGAEDNLTAVVVQIVETAVENAADMEEQTVAAVRPPLVQNAAVAGATMSDSAEIPTQNLEMPEIDNYETQQSYNASHFTIPEDNEISNNKNEVVADSTETVAPLPAETIVEEKPVYESENNGGGIFGKLVSSLLLLIIGAALGAGGYYYWLKSQPQPEPVVKEITPPQLTQPQTSNITQSAFDKNIRNVDKNPDEYINANGANAKDAEDYYLLGRAYLLKEDYRNAMLNFSQAEKMLTQVSEENRQMLANELSFAQSIANVDAGKRFFKFKRTELIKPETIETPNQNANTNLNTNTQLNNTNVEPQSSMPPVQ